MPANDNKNHIRLTTVLIDGVKMHCRTLIVNGKLYVLNVIGPMGWCIRP